MSVERMRLSLGESHLLTFMQNREFLSYSIIEQKTLLLNHIKKNFFSEFNFGHPSFAADKNTTCLL